MRLLVVMGMLVASVLFIPGCPIESSSDHVQRQQNEKLTEEATKQTGMPNIVNFRERKLLKEILEMRDQKSLVTYTYLYNEMKGELVFLGESVGYPIPYSTQYTNPQKPIYSNGVAVIPQADPNCLFSPESAEGSWVLLKDPNSDDVSPVYIEPRVITSQFKLH